MDKVLFSFHGRRRAEVDLTKVESYGKVLFLNPGSTEELPADAFAALKKGRSDLEPFLVVHRVKDPLKGEKAKSDPKPPQNDGKGEDKGKGKSKLAKKK